MFRCRSVSFMLAIMLLFFFLHLPFSLADDVSGNINEDTLWIAADSPYTVTGNIKIIKGVTLTIQPGVVVVMFQENIKSETGLFIRVDGTLKAQGTKTAPIIFTAQDKAFPWGGIVFTDISKDWDEDTSTGCIIDHCIIEYAGNTTIYGSATISTFSAQPYLANNTIRYTPSIGISATDILTAQSPSGQLRIMANHIHNHAEGIRLAIEGALIENNYFINNSQAIVVQTSSNDIIIKNNTIVNTELEVQGDGINLSLDNDENDNGIAAYFWEQTSGTPVDLEDPNSPYGTFTAPDVDASVENLVFDLTVTDDDGHADTKSLEIMVYGTNEPPVANAGQNLGIQEGQNVALNAAGSFDPDYGIKSYEWDQIEGPSGSWLSSTTIANPTFTAPPNVPDEGQMFTFQVTVTDTGDLQDTDTVDILVYSENIPPDANAGDDLYVVSDGRVKLDGSNSSDPDGSIASYSWVQTTGSPVTLEDADTARPGFLTPEVLSREELIFELTIRDTGTPQIETKDTVTITVVGEHSPPFAVTENSLKVLQGETARLWAFSSFYFGRLSEITIENNLLNSAAEIAGLINISLATADAAYDLNIIANQFEIVSENGLAIYMYNWPLGITDPDISLLDNWWGSDDAEAIEQLIFDGNDDFTLPEVEVNPAVSPPGSVGSTLAYPPMANAGEDMSASADEAVKLSGTGTYDPDTIATYAWTQLDGPAVELKNPGSDSPSFIAPLGGSGGTSLTFQLRVSIDGAFYDTDDVVVNIAPDAETTPVEHGNFLGCFITSIQ
ncbi:MAG: right-handed parallel beta-helix repeat-containing protein [Deltaproteobacteria bacterium]|nr:right-handed parallel beta-helix repeat-containing protein [Deltaproteobacteria bacterium]